MCTKWDKSCSMELAHTHFQTVAAKIFKKWNPPCLINTVLHFLAMADARPNVVMAQSRLTNAVMLQTCMRHSGTINLSMIGATIEGKYSMIVMGCWPLLPVHDTYSCQPGMLVSVHPVDLAGPEPQGVAAMYI
jgi:hypothetical protein